MPRNGRRGCGCTQEPEVLPDEVCGCGCGCGDEDEAFVEDMPMCIHTNPIPVCGCGCGCGCGCSCGCDCGTEDLAAIRETLCAQNRILSELTCAVNGLTGVVLSCCRGQDHTAPGTCCR